MKKYLQAGDVIDYTAGATIVSGQVIEFGEMIGIAVADIANGAVGPVQIVGVFEVTKVGSQAWSQGDRVFWDNANSRFTKTAAADADIVAGFAIEAVASGAGDTTGKVLLVPGMGRRAAAVADEATADGSDAATTQALANALKVKVNALLAALRVSGQLDQ